MSHDHSRREQSEEQLSGRGCQSASITEHGGMVSQNWGVDGFYGPPYALLQGSLDAIGSDPPYENAVPIR